MAAPVLLVEFTTDDPDDTTPTWTDVTEHVRSFSTSRGRDTELSLVEAGTATITLNNRGRDFDPTSNATLRPMNRWRISVVLDGPVTEEVFVGYAESYDQQWPAVGKDAVTIVQCVDEFKVLALDELPATDPPRDSYQDAAMFDVPSGYWPLLFPNVGDAAIGEPLVYVQGMSGGGSVTGVGAIVGQDTPGFVYTFGLDHWRTNELNFGQSVDMTNLTEFTIEGWISLGGTPAGTETLFRGPFGTPSATYTWRVQLNTSRQVIVQAKNSGGTTHTVTSTTALADDFQDTWHHIVGTITDGSLRVYIDGVQEASTAWTGQFEQIEGLGSNARFIVGNEGNDIGADFRGFDEIAFYKQGLDADRVLAHYQAGRERGFARGSFPGARIEDVLDAIGNTSARAVDTGTRQMTGSYMVGQAPLDELRKAEQADNVDAVLFIAKDGTITFLEDGHRSSSPYDTVQATFNDDGTGLPYQDIDVDYSDAFLFNEFVVAREGGTTTTETDTASVEAFKRRSRSLTSLPLTNSADPPEIAAALLAKYKDPMFRVTGLDLLATEAVAEAVFPLDIGARIRAIRHADGAEYLYPATDLYPSTTLYPLEGPLDQESFIQKIAVTGDPGRPIQVRLSVSPL